MTDAFVAFGSNLGDKTKNFSRVLDCFSELAGCSVVKCSELFETVPVVNDESEQPGYLNACIWLKTDQPCGDFFAAVASIESNLGRQRHAKWAPRTVDLDLLIFGDDLIWEPGICVPHPRMSFRQFVLQPLLEISPALVHPFARVTIQQLVSQLSENENVISIRCDESEKNAECVGRFLADRHHEVHFVSATKIKLAKHTSSNQCQNWELIFTSLDENQNKIEFSPKLAIDVFHELGTQQLQALRVQTHRGPHLLLDDGPVSESLASELLAAIDAMAPI